MINLWDVSSAQFCRSEWNYGNPGPPCMETVGDTPARWQLWPLTGWGWGRHSCQLPTALFSREKGEERFTSNPWLRSRRPAKEISDKHRLRNESPEQNYFCCNCQFIPVITTATSHLPTEEQDPRVSPAAWVRLGQRMGLSCRGSLSPTHGSNKEQVRHDSFIIDFFQNTF